MANEKKISVNTFQDGINTVVADELLAKTQTRYVLNCNILSQGEGQVGVLTNVKGNKQVDFDLPTGQNTCIGIAVDEEDNKFYFFIHNSTGLHSIYQYDNVSKSVTRLLQNLTDSGNINILNFNKDYLILHADVIKGRLYWVDGLNNARKTNISKLTDSSTTGYGGLILQAYIDAYKQTSPYAPDVAYDSDPNRKFNKIYGALRKFAIRYIYDDGEISNWSDFSAVPLPAFESFTGVNIIPTENNVIKISFNVGDRTVVKIQIAMLATNEDLLTDGALPWGIVANLTKSELGVSDSSQYTYSFYNDVAPIATDQAKVVRPYSFLPKAPSCQTFVKNALVYSNFKEGFEKVPISASVETSYTDLFLEGGVDNDFNEPVFNSEMGDGDYVSAFEVVVDINGKASQIKENEAWLRFNRHTLTIGNDVKKGNEFKVTLYGGYNTTFSIIATNTDDNVSIANKIKTKLIETGRIYRATMAVGPFNIYDNTIDGDGNVSFSYLFRGDRQSDYPKVSTSVTPVQYNSLKDTGQSVRNIKMGSSVKLGFEYEDFDGRKTLVYTNNNLIVPIKTINETEGIKATTIKLTINHKPPKWARRYQIVRSPDLIYGKYIQLLIQKVIPLDSEDEQDYLDLFVGSLYTYKKIHPNSPLSYEFKKGDRLRLIKYFDGSNNETYYDFFETEIIDYLPTVTERIRSNLVVDGTATITVSAAQAGNIGKFIEIEGAQRLIIGSSPTTYTLDATLGKSGESKTYIYYDLVDNRGVVRIRKPSGITLHDNSLVELYEPSGIANALSAIQFHEFDKKYEIINAGSDTAYHAGSDQDQSASQPAIVNISEGTAYVRNRELPINNAFPGTQLLVSVLEDESYSDFYASLLNDNGRINIEDTGDGERQFGSRMRFSNNFIEDTRINGLADFDNTDREDYNDQWGDIKLTKFDTNIIYVFKQLKTAYVPVDSRITQDNDGTTLNVGSAKLLNPIQYLAHDGGIGNNPESYAYNGTHRYFVSSNSGVIVRIGGNGVEPISKTFFVDNEVKKQLAGAYKNNARIYGGFDEKNGGYIVSIAPYNQVVYNNNFTQWQTQEIINVPIENVTDFEIVTPPAHGVASRVGEFIHYTPTTDYFGSDSFTYRVQVLGTWSPVKRICVTILEVPKSLAWRVKESSAYCLLNGDDENTGYLGWTTLEQYNTVTNAVTGTEKPNVNTDPDYVAPVYNTGECPLPPPPVGDGYLNVKNLKSKAQLTVEVFNGGSAPQDKAKVSLLQSGNEKNVIINPGTYTVKVSMNYFVTTENAGLYVNGSFYFINANTPRTFTGIPTPITVRLEDIP